MRNWLAIAVLWGAGVAPLRAAHENWAPPPGGPLMVTVTPASISFNATNPDVAAVNGASTASISWTASGRSQFSWSLSVQGDGASFSNCPAVPISAVMVSCAGATMTGGGGSGVCSAAAPLSTTPLVVASGTQGVPSAFYRVVVRFTLSDSWKYIAQLNPPCSLSLTYIANLQ
ncbi:MAG: hypothetical protein LAP40_26340 [Acidobacteriia bacterium]|nr:hypothetical protein [Terriglobia bacterium]